MGQQLNLTHLNPDHQEEMILTEKEKEDAIRNAIISAKKHKIWKLADKGATADDIERKIKAIDWEKEINQENILIIANKNKHRLIDQKKQEVLRKIEAEKKRKELKEIWTATKLYNLMEWTSKNVYGKKLLYDFDNSLLIKSLCFYISEDPRFESELGFSLKKGIIIRGISGVGKTHLVKCISNNLLNHVEVYSMLDVAESIKLDGEFILKNEGMIYLDDVGSEQPIINYYGTKINWFKEFIEIFYLKNTSGFRGLLLSTNCSFDQLEENYGFRVRSRMREMFNVIDVKGKDRRE